MALNGKGLTFAPALSAFISSRTDRHYTVISGGNNSGKSVLLKNLKISLGNTAYMAGPQRFYHVFELQTQRWNSNDYNNWHDQFRNNFNSEEQNTEQNFIDLSRILGSLSDKKRKRLFEICGKLIGASFQLKRRDPDNELSPRYVDMDGQNLAVGSTGTRLLMTLLGLCMDERFDSILIDEPELGLSPRIQSSLSSFFSDKLERKKYFPHLSHILITTHSHIFLDRRDISNNFHISRHMSDVTISQVSSMSELHDLQFNMLGNSLESLFLPSGIVICEGKTDKPFIDRLIQIRHPGRNVIVIESQGDVKRTFKSLTESLGDIYASPFRSRIFIIMDSVHSKGTVASLTKMGALQNNVVVWDKNGIEYVYPSKIVADTFKVSENRIGDIAINGDELSLNGITRRKTALCDEVLAAMTEATEQADELETKFLKPLAAAIGA